MLLPVSFPCASLQKGKARGEIHVLAQLPSELGVTVLTHSLEGNGGPLIVFCSLKGQWGSVLLLQVIKWVEFFTTKWRAAVKLSNPERKICQNERHLQIWFLSWEVKDLGLSGGSYFQHACVQVPTDLEFLHQALFLDSSTSPWLQCSSYLLPHKKLPQSLVP